MDTCEALLHAADWHQPKSPSTSLFGHRHRRHLLNAADSEPEQPTESPSMSLFGHRRHLLKNRGGAGAQPKVKAKPVAGEAPGASFDS